MITTTISAAEILKKAENGTANPIVTEYPDGTIIIGVEGTFDSSGRSGREARGLEYAKNLLAQYGVEV